MVGNIGPPNSFKMLSHLRGLTKSVINAKSSRKKFPFFPLRKGILPSQQMLRVRTERTRNTKTKFPYCGTWQQYSINCTATIPAKCLIIVLLQWIKCNEGHYFQFQ